MTPLFTATYPSPLGTILLTSDGESLTGLRFVDDQSCEAINSINRETLHPVIAEAIHWLDDYFAGRQPHTVPRLHPHGTAFQRRVWQVLFTIPYGQTRTYGYLARLLDCRSARAVGQAISRNPIALIIPCHRVIAAHGCLGGYAYGSARKQQLLSLEASGIGVPHHE